MKRAILMTGLAALVFALWLFITIRITNNTIFVSGIAVCLLTYGWFYDRLSKIKWLNKTILALGLFFAGLIIFIAVYGQIDTATYQEKAVLVLGAGIKGEKLSLTLQKRLDKAVEYHQRNPNAVLIVTGGQGPREDITEALAMERYLLSKGVPPNRIMKEEEALSTYENMMYSKALLKRYGQEDITCAVITSDFHLYRSAQFARMTGISCTRLGSDTAWYTWPANYLREAAAVIKLWLIKR